MAFTPFIRRCLETAHRETFFVVVDGELIPAGMPRGKYVLHEFYCDDPACDCRVARVIVIRGELGQGQPTEAVLTVGWEQMAFYSKAALPFPALSGSMLAPDRPQGPWAWVLAEILRPVYADRARLNELAAHYAEFRATLTRREN